MAGALATGNRCRLSLTQRPIPPYPGDEVSLDPPPVYGGEAGGQTYFEWSIKVSGQPIDRSNVFSTASQSALGMVDGTVTLNGYVPLEFLTGIRVNGYYNLLIEQQWVKTTTSDIGTKWYSFPFLVTDLDIGANVRNAWQMTITGKIQYSSMTPDPFDDAMYIEKDPVGLGYTPLTADASEFPYNIDGGMEISEELPEEPTPPEEF